MYSEYTRKVTVFVWLVSVFNYVAPSVCLIQVVHHTLRFGKATWPASLDGGYNIFKECR